MQIRINSPTSCHFKHWDMCIHNLFNLKMMNNPIKTWFFELIEDAIGSKAMQQFKKEEKDKKDSKEKNQPKGD